MSDELSSTAGSSIVSNEPIIATNNVTGSESPERLIDSLIKSIPEHSQTLAEVGVVTSDPKFKEELAAIESWFKVLSRPERTASIYTLLENADQEQKVFFVALLQRSLADEKNTTSKTQSKDGDLQAKPFVRGFRPPSLNLPELESPTTPRFTPAIAKGEALSEGKDASTLEQNGDAAAAGINIPGVGTVNPQLLNMAAASGLSTEAQMLAIQLVMSGLVQPQNGSGTQAPPKSAKKAGSWRVPGSAKYPTSALRHSALRSASLKSAGLKSAGPDSAFEGLATPKEEDFDPEALNDIPAWLRGLRLHKYTQCFEGMTWQEMVALNDEDLEKKGIVTLGARRRLLRTFEIVRKKMGLEGPSSATPTESESKLSGIKEEEGGDAEREPPHSAAAGSVSRGMLSVNSPVFVPRSALPRVSTGPDM